MKRPTPEEIAAKFRQVDVIVFLDKSLAAAVSSTETTKVPYDRLRK